jgi:hypothetical protein
MSFLQPTLNRRWQASLRGALPGLALAAFGAVALVVCATLAFRLPTGRPGPGFVPTLVAVALVGLGLAVAAAGAWRGAAPSGLTPRPGLLLCGAVLAFGLLLPAGFLPAAWVAGGLALLATPGMPAWQAVLGGLALAAAAALLFLGLLGIPAPLFGPR